MRLSELARGTDNNFNLLRMGAALAVLITHSFVLAIGSGDAEPLRGSLGMTLGSISVDIFFVTSGFLVTGSLLTKQNSIEFIWARVLRIFPALIAMLVLTVFGLGCFFTSLPLSSYLADAKTYAYLLKDATLITGVTWSLPGVFHGNPYKDVVNGSLWTLPYEIYMYEILATVWIVLWVVKASRVRLFHIAILTAVGTAGVLLLVGRFTFNAPSEGGFVKLFFMFFSGAAFHVLKERITISHRMFWLFLIALLASALTNSKLFFVIYRLTLAYLVFFVAYVPSGPIRNYNDLGDYSYGVYIYAFPIQQSIAALVPGVSVLSMILISTLATFLMAALSWHLLERRALGLKRACAERTSRFFVRSS